MSDTSRELIIDGDKWELRNDGCLYWNGIWWSRRITLFNYALAEHDARLAAESRVKEQAIEVAHLQEVLNIHKYNSTRENARANVAEAKLKEPQESKLRTALRIKSEELVHLGNNLRQSENTNDNERGKVYLTCGRIGLDILDANPPDPAIDPQVAVTAVAPQGEPAKQEVCFRCGKPVGDHQCVEPQPDARELSRKDLEALEARVISTVLDIDKPDMLIDSLRSLWKADIRDALGARTKEQR